MVDRFHDGSQMKTFSFDEAAVFDLIGGCEKEWKNLRPKDVSLTKDGGSAAIGLCLRGASHFDSPPIIASLRRLSPDHSTVLRRVYKVPLLSFSGFDNINLIALDLLDLDLDLPRCCDSQRAPPHCPARDHGFREDSPQTGREEYSHHLCAAICQQCMSLFLTVVIAGLIFVDRYHI